MSYNDKVVFAVTRNLKTASTHVGDYETWREAEQAMIKHYNDNDNIKQKGVKYAIRREHIEVIIVPQTQKRHAFRTYTYAYGQQEGYYRAYLPKDIAALEARV